MHQLNTIAHIDPSPFEVIEGTFDNRVLLVCDHASPVIPLAYGELGVDGTDRLSHVAWDIGAAEVTRHLARHFNCPAVLAGVSRLVIDCNRHPDDETAMPACSCGVPVPGNAGLGAAERQERVGRWFVPYHGAIAEQVAAFRRAGIAPAVVAIHSFTPCLGALRPWHVGVLWNKDGRMANPVLKGLAARSELVVGDNEPYSAREINYTLDTHAGAAGLPHVSFEIRQDLLGDAGGCGYWGELLADVLRPVLADLT